jgi:outer membrane immunogenic protein
MKKYLLAGVALFALTSAASAADLAARPYTKAPAMVAPAYNWSGFYAGVMGGYAWASRANGGFGGGTVGYNWQAPGSQFVFGIEVDAAGSSLKGTQSLTETVLGVPVTATEEDKVDAFGSVTGRVGAAVDASLLYFKGGYAWADRKTSITASAFGVPLISGSDSHVHSGYTVGAGWEYMLAPNWSTKVEYMYSSFGSETYTIAGISAPSGSFSFSTIKAGVNYHFR